MVPGHWEHSKAIFWSVIVLVDLDILIIGQNSTFRSPIIMKAMAGIAVFLRKKLTEET